jgi:hypothetical protein
MGMTEVGVVVFLTGDPLGFKDGPNRYCYVHCNPITKFDPLGLAATGLSFLDRNDVRNQIDETWSRSVQVPGPKGLGWLYNKQDPHEHGFVMMNDQTLTDVYKSKDPGSFIPKKEHWGQKKGAYYHAHPNSSWATLERKPSDKGTWGDANQLNDYTWAENNGVVVTVLHNSVIVTHPDGTTYYINRNDLKEGELSGSATKYRTYDDMAAGRNGTPMVQETVEETKPASESSTRDSGGSGTQTSGQSATKTAQSGQEDSSTESSTTQMTPIISDEDE